MFKLITPSHEEEVKDILIKIDRQSMETTVEELGQWINRVRKDIPPKKRVSYGRYSIIKKGGLFLYPLIKDQNIDVSTLCVNLFNRRTIDPFVRALAIQLISIDAEKTGSLEAPLDLFEKAAVDDSWELRECAAGFIYKMLKSYPSEMTVWYGKMVRSTDPQKRRFASESIRPIKAHTWIRKNPDFAFSILEQLYTEKESYPKSSVGNNLSDWMNILEERTLEVVKELASRGDKNSHWIAHRACRNLVKREPLLVMDILKADEYIYKDRKFYRKDFDND